MNQEKLKKQKQKCYLHSGGTRLYSATNKFEYLVWKTFTRSRFHCHSSHVVDKSSHQLIIENVFVKVGAARSCEGGNKRVGITIVSFGVCGGFSILTGRAGYSPCTLRLFATHDVVIVISIKSCLLYTSPSPRDGLLSRMPSSA